MSILAGIVSILDFFKDKIPVQGRIERIKNTLDSLEKEKQKLESEPWSEKSYARYSIVIDRIATQRQLMRNLVKE
jgi:uncharacterized protein YukE